MRSEQIAGWSCSGCKPIRARAHYVALSAATPNTLTTLTDQCIPPGGRKFREGTPLPEQQASLAPVKYKAVHVWPGEDKCHPGPKISE